MAAQLRLTNLHSSFPSKPRLSPLNHLNPSFQIPPIRSSKSNLSHSLATSTGGGTGSGHRGSGGGSGNGGGGGDESEEKPNRPNPAGPVGFLINGWRERVSADPQFPFKVLMEEIVGVSACVLGDMSTRPNFGLNELDFVFCTLVVGSIVNFLLMYLLAPTAAVSSSSLPSYIFAPGDFSLASRIGTFVYKGVTFAAVGFVAGLLGTAISNGLISVRKRVDPEFETVNRAPPTVLNAATWAAHMGLSSNVRYQTLNGVEFVMEKALPPLGFKVLVVVMRCLNNVLGGMSFVMLARLTGSQKVGEGKVSLIGEGSAAVAEENGNGSS